MGDSAGVAQYVTAPLVSIGTGVPLQVQHHPTIHILVMYSLTASQHSQKEREERRGIFEQADRPSVAYELATRNNNNNIN